LKNITCNSFLLVELVLLQELDAILMVETSHNKNI